MNKPLSALLVCWLITSLPERLSSKFSYLPSKLRFSAKYSFFGQSLSQGHYQPTYQPPEGVYLLIIPCPTNMVSVRVNFGGRFYLHFNQLFYSRLLDMSWLWPTRRYAPSWLSIISYPKRARGIIVKYTTARAMVFGKPAVALRKDPLYFLCIFPFWQLWIDGSKGFFKLECWACYHSFSIPLITGVKISINPKDIFVFNSENSKICFVIP